MKKNSLKSSLEAIRRANLSLGLLVSSSVVLLAFTYKTPVSVVQQERLVQEVDIPIILVEKEVEIPIVEQVKQAVVEPRKEEESTPIATLASLNRIEATASTNKNEKLMVSTSKPVDIGKAINFNPEIGPAPELNTVVKYPDIDAKFDGNWGQFLQGNLVYPYDAVRMEESGVVYVNFIIELDGSVSDVKVVNKDISPRLQKEAIRVVEKSPKWTPGSKNGEPVRTRITMPIRFVLG